MDVFEYNIILIFFKYNIHIRLTFILLPQWHMVQQSKDQRNVCALRCQKLATQKQRNAKTLLCFLDWFLYVIQSHKDAYIVHFFWHYFM